jgi:hypothetical protein
MDFWQLVGTQDGGLRDEFCLSLPIILFRNRNSKSEQVVQPKMGASLLCAARVCVVDKFHVRVLPWLQKGFLLCVSDAGQGLMVFSSEKLLSSALRLTETTAA